MLLQAGAAVVGRSCSDRPSACSRTQAAITSRAAQDGLDMAGLPDGNFAKDLPWMQQPSKGCMASIVDRL
jgi:hypothetical protein